MQSKVIEESGRATRVAVLAEGDEAVEQLGRLVRDAGIRAAQVTGVGAFERAVVGWFDREARDYRRNPVDEQCEVLSLIGDVALGPDGAPTLHAHVVLGLQDGTTRGGHLLEGHVFPTLEVVLEEPPATLRKRDHPELGLALIDLGEG
jgi:predicted DNA-binding protein with PD1-like motif